MDPSGGGKVISDMKKLKKASGELTKYLASGDWYGVCNILAWTPECDPTAIMKYCDVGGRIWSGTSFSALCGSAGLNTDFKSVYENASNHLFLDKKQNIKGLDAAVSALKNNATKFLNMPIMPKIMKSFSGGIFLDSENGKIENLQELHALLVKHPPRTIDYGTLTRLCRHIDDLSAETKEFIKAHPRLGRLQPELLESEVLKARKKPDYDAASSVLEKMHSELETYSKDFMKKVIIARKNLQNKGKTPDVITKRTKITINKLAHEYWNSALHPDSLNYMKNHWVGIGNEKYLKMEHYERAVEDAEKTREELKAWIDERTKLNIENLQQAKKAFPVLAEFLNTWESAIRFFDSNAELFKNWALPAKEIRTAAETYAEMLDVLISEASIRGENWLSKDTSDKLKALKNKSTKGWIEVKKAKNNLTPLNIESAIKAVCSREDCKVSKRAVEKLCEEVNSVAKKYL